MAYLIKDTTLSNIANSIRTVDWGYGTIKPESMANRINSNIKDKCWLAGTFAFKEDLSHMTNTISSTISQIIDDDSDPEARLYLTQNAAQPWRTRAYVTAIHFQRYTLRIEMEDTDMDIFNGYDDRWYTEGWDSDDEYYSIELANDQSHLIIEIPRPIRVSKEFYDLFMSCVRTSGSTMLNIAAAANSSAFNSQKSVYVSGTGMIRAYAFASCQTIQTVSAPVISIIGTSAFYRASKLWNIYAPSVSFISSYAFCGCSNLGNISFPKCVSIGNYAFAQAFSSTGTVGISLPSAITTIGTGAFQQANIPSISMSKLTVLPTYAFRSAGKLTSAYLPACVSVGQSAFYSCSQLTSVVLSNGCSVNSYAFANCSKLSKITGQIAVNIGNYAFSGCSKIYQLSFGAISWIGPGAFYSASFDGIGMASIKLSMTGAQTIGQSAFANCKGCNVYWIGGNSSTTISAYAFYNTSITELRIFCNSVATLAASNALTGTRLSTWYQQTGGTSIKYTGSIYVPASLVANYKTATNWVYWSSYIYSM